MSPCATLLLTLLSPTSFKSDPSLFYTVELLEFNKVPSCTHVALLLTRSFPQSGLIHTPLCRTL